MGKFPTNRMFDCYLLVRKRWSFVTLAWVYPKVTFEHSIAQKFFKKRHPVLICFHAYNWFHILVFNSNRTHSVKLKVLLVFVKCPLLSTVCAFAFWWLSRQHPPFPQTSKLSKFVLARTCCLWYLPPCITKDLIDRIKKRLQTRTTTNLFLCWKSR